MDSMFFWLHPRSVTYQGWVLLGFLFLGIAPFVQAQTPVTVVTPDDPGELDNFGFVLSYDQDRLLVGAPGRDAGTANAGVAYVFRREDGTWLQEATLRASDPELGAEFGDAVVLQGRYAYVGSNQRDNNRGGIYVFERDNGTWVEQTILTPSDDEQGDVFSHDFVIEGDRMLISSFGDSELADFGGAAYVFERDASGQWSEVAKLLPADPVESGWFGAFVALDGDRALLGATGYEERTGAAYIFEREASGTWQEVARLTASDGAPDDRFGGQVALDGDYAYVAAPRTDAGAEESGAVYVFRQEGGQWNEVARLTSARPVEEGRFGVSITAQGEQLLIGASGEGMVYRYERTGATTWEEQEPISTGVEEPLLGRDLVLNGTELYVGDRGLGGNARGGVFQFDLSSASTAAAEVPEGAQTLTAVYPNPFAASTRLAIELPQAADVTVTVFDVLGRRVRAYPARSLLAGRHTLEVDLSGQPAGIYLYRVQTVSSGSTAIRTGRMVLR